MLLSGLPRRCLHQSSSERRLSEESCTLALGCEPCLICVRVCAMRMAITSTWSGVFTAASCHAHRDCDHGSSTMRDLHLSWDVVVGSCTVMVVCCVAWSVSYPQPPLRRVHECTVGIEKDPPVRCSHPGRMMRTPGRQLLRAWLVLAFRTAHVDTSVGRGVVVWCCLTSALLCSSSRQSRSSSARTRDVEQASSSISYCSYRTTLPAMSGRTCSQ